MNVPLSMQDLTQAEPVKITTKYLNPRYRFQLKGADEKTYRTLERKYKKFENHSDIYTAAVGAYMSVGRAFTSVELATSPYGEKKFYTQIPFIMLQDIVKPSNAFSRSIALENKYVETKLLGSNLDFKLDFSKPERLGAAEKIVKQYFPEFVLPTAFKEADLEGQGNLKRSSIGPRIETLLSVEQISNIIPSFSSPNSTAKTPEDEREQNRFKLPKGYKEANFGKIAYIRLVMELDRCFVLSSEGYPVAQGSSGTLLGGYNSVQVPVIAELVFRWPWEFAQYVTCSEDRSDFIPFLFYQYTNWHRIAYASKRTRGGGLAIKPPIRLSHLGNISEQIEKEKRAGRIVKPRLNDENFAIIGTGEPADLGKVVWIDRNANRINEYMSQIKSAYSAENKAIDLTKLTIKGTSLFYDAHNEKFVYVREAGSDKSASDVSGIQLIDLTGSLALDNITIARKLNERLINTKDVLKDFQKLVYNYVSGAYEDVKVSKPLNRENLLSYGFSPFDAARGADIISTCFTEIAESPEVDVTWATIGGSRTMNFKSYGDSVINEESADGKKIMKLGRIRAFSRLLNDLAQDMLRDFNKITVAYSYKVDTWRFLLVLITKYAKDDAQYQEALQAAIQKNTVKKFTKEEILNPDKRLNVASLPGLTTLMPHQIESMLDLSERPRMTFLEAVVGGGKTAMGLMDLCDLLQRGVIKRPLVDVPGHLVKNWATEIRKFSKGQVNCIILTIQTVRRLQQVYLGDNNPASKPNYTFLKNLIEACPPNTVFLTNFRFASIDKEEIVYANSVITRYYSAEFLREMQFDLVNIDESHGVKTLGSNQTQGAAIVTSVAAYKRLMSGTLVNNTLLDLVGQSAIGNPSALGNTKNFIANYGASYSGDDDENVVGEWRPDAASRIINDMRPFVKRIIHKRNRIAFMLPEAVENFHSVSMTDLQKEFYDAMLQRSFDDLKEKNPKLFAKIMDGNEADEGAISVGLSTHFQAIEEFLCAPDQVSDFLDLEGITDKDKISPKVPKIVELLDQHFKGTLDNSGNYLEDPNQFKVIIFGNRRATSKHVFKHLPERYRKIAVHYTADNKQAAEIFEHSPKIRILVADGASITSGLNLQFAARMIRCETVWSPGDLEQAFARIWRPAFGSKNGERLKVYLDWLVCNQSLDIAKIGRIVSKLVEKVKYDRQEDENFVYNLFTPSPAFMELSIGEAPMHDIIPQVKVKQPIAKMLDTLKLIKMNHQSLIDLREMGQLAEYFANYALINDFEIQEFNREKKEGLQQLITIPEECRSTIPNSRPLAFQSRVPGINPEPFDESNYYGYKPISIIESTIALNEAMELDEDDDNYIEVNPVSGGELVDTEFGIGRITGILANEVWVSIVGLGNVRVPKATAWIITNPKAIAEVERKLKSGSIVRNPPGIKSDNVYADGTAAPAVGTDSDKKKRLVTFKRKPTVEVEEDTPEEKKEEIKQKAPVPVKKPAYDRFDEDEDEDEDNVLEIDGSIIDGQVALSAKASDSDSDMLVQDYDFKPINKYIAIEVRNSVALSELLDLLKSKFTVRDEFIDGFDMYRDLLKTKRLAVATPDTFNDTRLFFKSSQVNMLKQGVIRPYPIVWDGVLFVAIDAQKTPAVRDVTRVVRGAGISGVKISPTQENLHVKFYKRNSEALEELGQIAQNITIPNLEETVDFLNSIKKQTSKIKETPKAEVPAKKIVVVKKPEAKKPVEGNKKIVVVKRK